MCRACLSSSTHGLCNGIPTKPPVAVGTLPWQKGPTQRWFIRCLRATAGLHRWALRRPGPLARGGHVVVEWSCGGRELAVSLSDEGELRIEMEWQGYLISRRLEPSDLAVEVFAALHWLETGRQRGD
jgi:hypothetical protein